MRTKIIGLALLGTMLAVGLSSCQTPQPSVNAGNGSSLAFVDTNGLLYVAGYQVTPQAVAGTLSLAANVGATYEIRQDAHARDYFVSAKSLIDVAIANGNYVPDDLKVAMSNLSISELRDSASAQKTIATIIDTYAQYFSAVQAKKIGNVSPYLIPMLQGIADGLGKAIANTAPSP